MTELWFVLIPAVASLLGVRWMIHHATHTGMVDQPDERRLHSGTVPRGGGMIIAVVVVPAMFSAMLISNTLSTRWLVWLLVASGFAVLGGLDDWRSRSIGLRLPLQLLLSVLFVVFSPVFDRIEGIDGFVWVVTLATLGLVWMVNLFNFVDGADGYATTSAIVIFTTSAVIFSAGGVGVVALPALAIVGACSGFLRWNWAPAKIFMGDAGSYFLGFQLGAMVALAWAFELSPYPLLILLSPIVVDASLTLAYRVVTRQAFWRAHQSHLYQLLVLNGCSHRALNARLMVLLLCLTPLAWSVRTVTPSSLAVTVASYFALAGVWLITYPRLKRRLG